MLGVRSTPWQEVSNRHFEGLGVAGVEASVKPLPIPRGSGTPILPQTQPGWPWPGGRWRIRNSERPEACDAEGALPDLRTEGAHAGPAETGPLLSCILTCAHTGSAHTEYIQRCPGGAMIARGQVGPQLTHWSGTRAPKKGSRCDDWGEAESESGTWVAGGCEHWGRGRKGLDHSVRCQEKGG